MSIINKFIFFIILLINIFANGKIKMLNVPDKHPFSYDLGVKIICNDNYKQLTICCHGYGHNNQIVDVINSGNIIKGYLLGFNFPDYNIKSSSDHSKISYGTIYEILPLLYLLKYYACDQKVSKINFYGFSAGGGAIINALAILYKNLYEKDLNNIGIDSIQKNEILKALKKGIIILDCPLKSIDEIIDFRGSSKELKLIGGNYNKNKMNPIDNLQFLNDIKLNIVLNFQNPDDILSNCDDQKFIDRLKQANKGSTKIISSNDQGHNSYHKNLWNYLRNHFK